MAANSSSDDSQSSGMNLEEYMVLYAQYKSNGNATEYERLITEMTLAEQSRQEWLASTNGAALQHTQSNTKVTVGTQPTRATSGYMTSVIWSPTMYYLNTNTKVGEVTNPSYIAGSIDGYCTRLWTNGWDGYEYGGEALTNGYAYNVPSNAAYSDIYFYACTDNTSWDNYVIVEYYNGIGGNDGWHLLSMSRVTHTPLGWEPSGRIYGQFSNVSVSCCTPPPYPTYYSPLIKNSVYVDCIEILSY